MTAEVICTVRTERQETVVGILHALDGPEFNFQLSAMAENLDRNRRYFVTVGYCDEQANTEGQYIAHRVVVSY
jgi:hypothetical protein